MEHETYLTSLTARKYKDLNDTDAIAIAPADLAIAVYREIDPKEKAPIWVRYAALLELRQLARAECRKRNKDDEQRVEEQGTLFDFQLQPRYPACRKQADDSYEDVYVKRSYLTDKERWRNITRLSREADRKLLHRDALQAETEYLASIGQLPKEDDAEEQTAQLVIESVTT